MLGLVSDILIVGGGHAGLWLGTALSLAGFSVRVVDPETVEAAGNARPDGRTLALLGGSRKVGEAQGVWPAVAAIGQPVFRVEVRDTAGGAHVAYDGRALGGATFAWGVENRVLRKALLDAFLAAAGSEAWTVGRLDSLRREGSSIAARLTDGRIYRASLLVGADGRGSRVRDLAKIGLGRETYAQSAVACVVAHDEPHGETVRERLRPAGPLALLPLTGGRCGVTWVESHAEAAAVAALPPDALLERLDREIDGGLGRLELASPVAAWPLGAQHARRYVAPRLALVGDAAHGVHPIHAQGFNMGVADIGALVEALAEARRRGRDIGGPDTLLAYERARWWDNERRLRLTDGLNRLFSNDLAPARLMRGAVLRAIDTIPPLKALAVREGMRAG
ncbi:MAG: FAD-dependent monooxygenase [Geminicoccaceae bacterium]